MKKVYIVYGYTEYVCGIYPTEQKAQKAIDDFIKENPTNTKSNFVVSEEAFDSKLTF